MLKVFLENVVTYTEHAWLKTVTTMDVVYARSASSRTQGLKPDCSKTNFKLFGFLLLRRGWP